MLTTVKEKITELKKLGYQDFQIRKIFLETVNTTDIENLPTIKLQHLLEILELQISFAYKCKDKIRNK